MSQVEPAAAASRERYPGWDAVVAVLLGLTLLGAGWLDARTYLGHVGQLARGGRPPATLSLNDPQGGEHVTPDELYRSSDSFALLENVGALETNNGIRFRRAFGPASIIRLTTFHPSALLSVEFYNDIPDQDITVRCNDTVLEELPQQPAGLIARTYAPALQPGMNHIRFEFARYNHGPQDLGSPDPRPLAGGNFLRLDVNLN